MKNLSDLAFFVELSKYQNLSKAAFAFQVSAAAVSKRLARLEDRLTVRLMHRTTRRIGLTQEGERYLEEAHRLILAEQELEQSLAAGQEEPRGLLRVNASLGFGRQRVADLVDRFCLKYPKVKVLLYLTDHPVDLVESHFDVNIRFGSPPDSRLVARKVAANRRVLVASPQYLDRHSEPTSVKALSQHQCIVIRQDNQVNNTWVLQDGSQVESVKVNGGLTTNHGEVAVQWALNHRGIVLRSEWDVQEHLEKGGLRRVLKSWEGLPADIYAVYPHKKNLSAKVRKFVDLLLENFAVDE